MKHLLPAEKFEKLYDLQDEVLTVLSGHFGPFYVSGGAALSRFYLNHRFTNDLDLRVSRLPCFHKKAAPVVQLLTNHFQAAEDNPAISLRNIHLWTKGRFKLKISLSNDNFEQVGLPLTAGRIPVDNMKNMLVKKLKTIHDRDDPKDLFDIVSIASSFSFHWGDVLKHAQKTALYVQMNSLLQFSRVVCRYARLLRLKEPSDLFRILGVPSPIGFNNGYMTVNIERSGKTSETHSSTLESLPRELRHAASRLKAVSVSDCHLNKSARPDVPSCFTLVLGGTSILIRLSTVSVSEKALKKFSKVPAELIAGMEWMHYPLNRQDIETNFERIRNDLLLAGDNSLGSGKTPIGEARPVFK